MMKMKTKQEKDSIAGEVIELNGEDAKSISVSVNRKRLPLDIGSKVNIGDGLARTVMKMQVNEDGNVMYGIQWVDGIDFKLEWMTYNELCHMSSCIKNKPKISQ